MKLLVNLFLTAVLFVTTSVVNAQEGEIIIGYKTLHVKEAKNSDHKIKALKVIDVNGKQLTGNELFDRIKKKEVKFKDIPELRLSAEGDVVYLFAGCEKAVLVYSKK